MNIAECVYCAPEDISQLDDQRFYSGLGLTNINIEPHFIYTEEDFSEDEKILRDVLYLDSFNVDIYCIEDGSFIVLDSEVSYYDSIYLMKGGIKSKVSNNRINK